MSVYTQSYFFNDDVFNFNYAQAKASTGNFQEAEEVFLLINSEKIKNDYVYLSWLARCCECLSLSLLSSLLMFLALVQVFSDCCMRAYE